MEEEFKQNNWNKINKMNRRNNLNKILNTKEVLLKKNKKKTLI